MIRLKNTQGSSYIFVLVITAAIFIILTLAIGTTKYQAVTSRAYIENANLYYLSESGAYKALDVINEIIYLADLGEEHDGDLRLALAEQFLREKIGILLDGEYYNFIAWEIETLFSGESTAIYNVEVSIKSEVESGIFTVMSVAGNSNTSVKIIASIEFVTGDTVNAQITSMRQI